MTIRSTPTTDAYRAGHSRIFGETRPPKPTRCADCGKTPCDPNYVHPLKVPEKSSEAWRIVDEVSKRLEARYAQTETCQPCNEEHPRGQPCGKCGRKLLLG